MCVSSTGGIYYSYTRSGLSLGTLLSTNSVLLLCYLDLSNNSYDSFIAIFVSALQGSAYDANRNAAFHPAIAQCPNSTYALAFDGSEILSLQLNRADEWLTFGEYCQQSPRFVQISRPDLLPPSEEIEPTISDSTHTIAYPDCRSKYLVLLICTL